MKKTRLLFVSGILLMLALSISACKSTPPAEPEPVPAPVETPAAPVAAVQAEPAAVAKPVDESLTALRDKMEALRAEGLKYGLDKYRAEEWAAAEAVRKTGLDAYGSDYDLAQKSFEDAIARYEAIRIDSFNSISAELEASIIEAREEAIRVGADAYYPEQFAMADAAADTALACKEKGDMSGAYDAGQIALMRYKTLQNGMRAVELRTKIERNDFAQYAQEDFDKADIKYAEACEAYGTADVAAFDASVEAVALFSSVNNAGFKVLSENLSYKVEDMKNLCDSIKAQKAAKADYAEALAIYNAAYAYGDESQWEEAYNSGNDALDAFSSIYQDVLLRRNAADAAIEAAKSKQEEGTDLALKADEIAPLPEDAEGYSEELPVVEETATMEESK